MRCILLGVLLTILLPLGVAGMEEGFETLYEGLVPTEQPRLGDLDLVLRGQAGLGRSQTRWGSVGARARIRFDDLVFYTDALVGTQTQQLLLGTETRIYQFDLAGEVLWARGNPLLLGIRAGGEVGQFRLATSLQHSTAQSTLTLGGSTDLDGVEVSAGLALAPNRFQGVEVGAKTELGGTALTGSAGWAPGGMNLGLGASQRVGPVTIGGSLEYDAGLGLNSSLGGRTRWSDGEASATLLLDGTGLALEADAQWAPSFLPVDFNCTSRYAAGGLNVQLGAGLPLRPFRLEARVGLESANGFGWAELAFEWRL